MTYTDLIFLFAIFPASAILSMLDRSSEYKNLILIITSLLFFSWGKPFVICLIFLSLVIDWALGLCIGSIREKNRTGALLLTAADGVMNTALMLIFGHNYLFADTALAFEDIMLPIGMGYYSLRGFSYVSDVFRGKIRAEKNA